LPPFTVCRAHPDVQIAASFGFFDATQAADTLNEFFIKGIGI
jgi:hypothetical protein